MNKSTSIASLAAALAKAQGEMPAVKMDSTNPFLKSRYASLGAVIETARPILAKHGLSIVQSPINVNGEIGLTTTILHSSGEWMEDTISLPMTDEKGKSMAQVAGSIISYMRRYAMQSVLAMYGDEDTDGHAPTEAKREQTPAEKAAEQTEKARKAYAELAERGKRAGVQIEPFKAGTHDEMATQWRAQLAIIKEAEGKKG